MVYGNDIDSFPSSKYITRMRNVVVNASELQHLVSDLAQLSHRQIPYAVKDTLYQLALDMKKKGGTIEQSAASSFKYRRSRTFMQQITWADYPGSPKTGLMESWAGIAGRGRISKIAPRFQQQEDGGSLERPYVPTTYSRVGKNKANAVQARKRLEKLDPIDLRSKSIPRRMAKIGWISSIGGEVLLKSKKGNRNVIYSVGKRTVGVKKRQRNGKRKYLMTPLYSAPDGKTQNLRGTGFVSKAGIMTERKMPEFWRNAVEKQLRKAFSRLNK